jgi:hypothetical protein
MSAVQLALPAYHMSYILDHSTVCQVVLVDMLLQVVSEIKDTQHHIQVQVQQLLNARSAVSTQQSPDELDLQEFPLPVSSDDNMA